MNQAELYQLLLESGLTVYRDWADTPAPLSLPHVVIKVPRDRGLGGDLSRLADWHMVRLELWSRRADLAAEGSIRRVLDRIGADYTLERVPLPEQGLHETVFEFEAIEVLNSE